MGIPSEMRDAWISKRQSILIASPQEPAQLSYTEQKALDTSRCTEEAFRAGAKAASIACVASAIPTLIGVRVIPWAKAHINYTGQALIISSATIAAYFIAVDKTILACSRRNNLAKYGKSA